MDLAYLVDLIHHWLNFATCLFLHMDVHPDLAMVYSFLLYNYTLWNCSFTASAFNASALTIDPLTCKSPMPWLSCLSFEMKVQNDFGLSVMLVVRNWLICDTLTERSCSCTFFLMSQNSCQSSWFLVFFALLYTRCFLLHNFFTSSLWTREGCVLMK